MENIFTIAESCLHQSDVTQKVDAAHRAQKLFKSGQLSFESSFPVLPITETKFPDKPQLLKPRDMPRRRLNSPTGKPAFFHALAHIEFIAISLAWDILYRFRGLYELLLVPGACGTEHQPIESHPALLFLPKREYYFQATPANLSSASLKEQDLKAME